MNLIKENHAPAQPKKLALEVFKDKMMSEVEHEKGGSSGACVTVAAAGAAAGWLISQILDTCHD